jgi:hypothetical protein
MALVAVVAAFLIMFLVRAHSNQNSYKSAATDCHRSTSITMAGKAELAVGPRADGYGTIR